MEVKGRASALIVNTNGKWRYAMIAAYLLPPPPQ
jgi:hypothetical protein